MKKFFGLLLLCSIIALSFTQVRTVRERQPQKDTSYISSNESLLMAVLWYQRSAEMRALYYQGYNLAKLRLDECIQNQKDTMKKAVIVDVDETILDNSPLEADFIKNNEDYDPQTNWKKWVNEMDAKAVPGAVDFLNYAKSKNVEVFYISNRSAKSELQPTMHNLKKERFPYVDEQHCLFKVDKDTTNKEARRKQVAKKYDIILLLGDNMSDFAAIFDNRGKDFGFAKVDAMKNDWGKKFIVLPNPMYGDWDKVVLKNNFSLSDKEKSLLRKKNLIYTK